MTGRVELFQFMLHVSGRTVAWVYIVSLVQPENAAPPTLVTLFGIVILVKRVQPENAFSPILVALFGIVTLIKPVQP